MARRRLSDTSHPDATLDEQHWLRFGELPQPPMRDKIIFLTADEVATVGPAVFNVASVCDRLGVTHPMVNHYFDGRDSLLAETAFVVYQRYIEDLWEAVRAVPADPSSRLRAWMLQQIKGTADLGGWGGIFNYPSSSMHISGILEERYGDDMRRLFESNTIRLAVLIEDLRHDTSTSLDRIDLVALRAQFLADPQIMARSASVAWSTLGVAVWNAGQHLASSRIEELQANKEVLIEAHIERMIGTILI
jgi:AcrR family transcriptional regulator